MLKLLIVTVAAVIVSRMPLDAQTRTFYPNSQRYKDSMPATSNRSGAATLTGRALVDKNGRTLIELTTLPVFDTAQTPPGKISKVQIKGIKANGVVSYGNYKEQETGGYWSLASTDFTPAQKLQIQANIRDIDPTRTDVVTIEVIVARLPDVTVSSLNLPAEVYTNTAITLFSQISELNSSVGATTNCVLYVNGIKTDQVLGLWVDKGDTVSCQFSATFVAPGVHAIEVKAEGVAPSDWDTANNSRTGTITAINPIQATWSAFAQDWTNDYRYLNYGWWTSENGQRDWDWLEYGIRRGQYFRMDAFTNNVSVTFPLNVTRTEHTNSTYLANGLASSIPLRWSSEWQPGDGTKISYQCGDSYIDDYGHQLCSHAISNIATGTVTQRYTSLYVYRYAAKVNYVSAGFDKQTNSLYPQNNYYYSWSSTVAYQSPSYLSNGYGNTYSFDISFSDGSQTIRANGLINLEPNNYEWNSLLQCASSAYSSSCYHYQETVVGKFGHSQGTQ